MLIILVTLSILFVNHMMFSIMYHDLNPMKWLFNGEGNPSAYWFSNCSTLVAFGVLTFLNYERKL